MSSSSDAIAEVKPIHLRTDSNNSFSSFLLLIIVFESFSHFGTFTRTCTLLLLCFSILQCWYIVCHEHVRNARNFFPLPTITLQLFGMSYWKMNGFFDNFPAPFWPKSFTIKLFIWRQKIIKLNSFRCKGTFHHHTTISQVKYYNLFRKTCFIFQIYLIASNKYINYLNENERIMVEIVFSALNLHSTQLNHSGPQGFLIDEWIHHAPIEIIQPSFNMRKTFFQGIIWVFFIHRLRRLIENPLFSLN